MPTPDRYAVFGNPISHSLSPDIHAAFAEQTQQHIHYEKVCVEKDAFVEAANTFFTSGGRGLNITVPFKQEAAQYAEELSRRALMAGAANFLMPKDGHIFADNTDGYGLVLDLKEGLQWPIKNQRILILGAGGAVRGVLLPLLEEAPAEVVIANRTQSKAVDLATTFTPYGCVRACCFGEEGTQPFDLIINGTSASLSGEIPAINERSLNEATKIYDMVYGQEDTPFMTWAKLRGATQVADGLGMLIGQAAESFYLWRGKKVDIAKIKSLFR